MKYKTIINRSGKKIDLHICQTQDGSYIIGIPEGMKDNAEMFVEMYNSGGKQANSYVENVQHAMTDKGNPIEKNYADFVTDFPLVVPIVPDLKGLPDLQQMSVESVKDFQIHEKVKECIDDARTQIEKITGKKVQDKIFLSGYSASGVFAQRFALAYPEIINRALIGGAAGTIPVPTRKIKYPIGIQDYENLFGKEFDSEAYKQIQFAYYVGEFEARKAGNFDINGDRITSDMQIPAPMHDMSFRSVSTPKEVGIEQRKLLGQTLNERYKNAIEANKRYGIDMEGIVVSDSSHRYIHNSVKTPSSRYLKDQIIAFYGTHKQFDPKAIGCCEDIDNSYQRTREMDYSAFISSLRELKKDGATTRQLLEKLYEYYKWHVTYNYDQLQIVKLNDYNTNSPSSQCAQVYDEIMEKIGELNDEMRTTGTHITKEMIEESIRTGRILSKNEASSKLDEIFEKVEGRPLSSRNKERCIDDYYSIIYSPYKPAKNGFIKINESPEYSYMHGLSRKGYQPVYRNGMLIDGVCSEYVNFESKVCGDLGIKHKRIEGIGTTGHAWSMVYLPEEEQWVNFDMTMARFYLDNWLKNQPYRPEEWICATTQDMFKMQPTRKIFKVGSKQCNIDSSNAEKLNDVIDVEPIEL